MKYTTIQKAIVFSLFGILLISSACKSPLDDLKITLNTEISSSNYGIRIVDANSTGTVPQNVTISLAGNDKKYIYSSDGSRNITVQNGVSSFLLEPGLKPTPENPIRFTILCDAPGYLRAVFPVEINAEGNKALEISMVKISAPPKGVAAKQETVVVDASTGTNSELQFVIPAENSKQEAAVVVIPAGTKMFDENGAPVSGNVQVQMVHFDNRNPESIKSFPGGFDVSNVVDKNGNVMDPISFETAGFISMEMTNGSQSVKSFSKPIDIKVEINPETFNPTTGTTTKEGDTIPFWSLDTKTGQWKEEGNALVVKNTSTNKLEAIMIVPHLSWWNLDYFYNSCYTGSTIRLNTNINTNTYRYMELVQPNGQFYKSLFEDVKNGNVIGFYNAPRGRQCKLRIYSGQSYYDKGTMLTESQLFNLCGSTVNVSATIPPPTIVNVNIAGNCPSNGRVLKPSIYVYFKKPGDQYFNYLGYMNNGRFTTDRFKVGETYVFGASYGGKWYEYTRTIDRTDYNEIMELPSSTPGCK